jgi:dTDP-4-dehydrorhamnose 3,5-epimerase-like enzyme
MSDWSEPTIVDLPAFRDELGALSVIEGTSPFPFDIKRVYFLFDVPSNATRGAHAHRDLHQLIIAVSGSFRVRLHDGMDSVDFLLDRPDRGLTVPPGYWRNLTGFSAGSSALVLASNEYDPNDYIKDFDEFQEWAAQR